MRRNGLHLCGMLVCSLSLALVVGCDKVSKETDGGITADGSIGGGGIPDAGAPPTGLVTFKKAGETATATFMAGSEQFLVVPYSAGTAGATVEYSVTVKAGAAASPGKSTFHLKLPPREPLSVRNPALFQRWQERLSVERWQRRLAEHAAAQKLWDGDGLRAKMNKTAACTLSSECGPTEVCSAGACAAEVTVNVGLFASSAKTITAAVQKKGTSAAVLVDKANTVAAADIDKLLSTFDSHIYKRDVAIFGNPPLKTGGSQLSSDRNADGMVWLVLTSKVPEKKKAVGFFVATDFEKKSANADSNEADILYLDATLDLAAAYTTTAHELQHLLNFGTKVYRPQANGGSGGLEALWLDEGQSHFAEDICGYGGENTTVLNQEVFTAFSEKNIFSTAEDSLAMRGKAFLFVRYLFEQAGGATLGSGGAATDQGGIAFLQKLRGSSKVGTEALTGLIGTLTPWFANWLGAVALDGRNVTEYVRYNYHPLTTEPTTGAQVGVVIRGNRNDDKGAATKLEGPLEDDLTADLPSETITEGNGRYLMLKGKTGAVDVTVSSQNPSFNFMLIKVK